MRLTKTLVDAARYEGDGNSQDIRWDDAQPGFGLRVYPTGAKSFVVAFRLQGRKRIVSLGRYGEATKDGPLTVQRAREKAQKVRVAARDGEDLTEKPWARIQERAGLEALRIHDLRHSFASVGAGAGLSLPIIGKLLGHTQAATTQRYAHLAADPLHEAADRISGEIAAAMNGGKPAEVVKLNR